jgi:hypothetical protein
MQNRTYAALSFAAFGHSGTNVRWVRVSVEIHLAFSVIDDEKVDFLQELHQLTTSLNK